MSKWLITTFLLLTLTANLFAIIPSHSDGEGCCSEECCASAQMDAPESLPATLCCIINGKQNAETNPTPAITSSARRNQNLPPLDFVRPSESISYIQQAQFPSAPTRHLAGSSIRYLDNNVFLI